MLVQLAGSVPATTENPILTYYNSLAGVSATSISGVFTLTNLFGVNLFITDEQSNYTAAEISAMSGFLNGGGTIFFLEDISTCCSVQDAAINSALAALGSNLSIIPALLDSGIHIATGSHIIANPFTVGVNKLSYAATSGIHGGTALFTTSNNTPFVAFASSVPEPPLAA